MAPFRFALRSVSASPAETVLDMQPVPGPRQLHYLAHDPRPVTPGVALRPSTASRQFHTVPPGIHYTPATLDQIADAIVARVAPGPGPPAPPLPSTLRTGPMPHDIAPRFAAAPDRPRST